MNRQLNTIDMVEESSRQLVRQERWKLAKRMRVFYFLYLIPAVLLLIFHYIPIYGLVIAFKDFYSNLGIIRSPWNNFEHFRRLLESIFFWRVFRNTVIISVLRIAFGFPAPIVFAILINEIPGIKFKRVVQSISYLPHFFSWVVLSGIIIEVFSPDRGMVGYLFYLLGKPAPMLLAQKGYFRSILVMTGIWKSIGWGTIVYLATISAINPELYEAAGVDGASRFQVATKITLPSLIPVMTILFILRLGGILNAGFDQILNLYNPLVYEVADIIDTFVYRVGLMQGKFGFGAAVGLFKNVIGVTLLLGANRIIRKFSEYALW